MIDEDSSILTAKKAIIIAKEYVMDVMKVAEYSIDLEEIEISENEEFWFVTFGIRGQGIYADKQYKIVKLDSKSGKVKSIKIRN